MRWRVATICRLLCAACSILLVAPSLSQQPGAEPRERTLLFVGDVMLSRAVGARMQSEDDWTFPFTEIGATLAAADLTFGNLECPVSDVGRNRHHLYSFRADPRALEGLKFAGFDVMSVANNHAYDWGPDALLDTVRRLREAGIHPVGGGANDLEAHYPALLDLGGLRVAFLAYVNIEPKEATAAPDRPGVAWVEPERVLADIRFARPLADLVIVGLHWGVEYSARPGRDQTELAHQMIDAGADLIVGGHPHVVQPMEEYQGRWIAYSLGNFVFDQRDPATRRAIMLQVRVEGKQIAGVTAIPIRIDRSFRAILAPAEERLPKPFEAKTRVEGSSLGAR
ncbi:MAG: CapA family protein [Acidobacteriia bacterium]|nr:CapA family protein [Terriglobia bacterium]